MSERAKRHVRWFGLGLAGLYLLAACVSATPEETRLSMETSNTATSVPPTETPATSTPEATPEEEYRIVTLLPPDAIPSIDDPQFYDAPQADEEYRPDELVLGVEFGGDARAYPIGLLARHEIVNDTVGGQPIAVTY
jgi:hypothetical protein